MANKHLKKLRSAGNAQLHLQSHHHHHRSLLPPASPSPASSSHHPPIHQFDTLSPPQQGADSTSTTSSSSSFISLGSFKSLLPHRYHHLHEGQGQGVRPERGHGHLDLGDLVIDHEKHDDNSTLESSHMHEDHSHYQIHNITKFITRSISLPNINHLIKHHNPCITDVGDHIFHPILCKPSHHVKHNHHHHQYHKQPNNCPTHDRSNHHHHSYLPSDGENQHHHKHQSNRNHHIQHNDDLKKHHHQHASLGTKAHNIGLPPKGHFAIYVDDGEERFVVPISYLYHPLFQDLLHRAQDEFGYHQQGGLILPCSLSEFQHILSCMQSDVQSHHHHVNITTKSTK